MKSSIRIKKLRTKSFIESMRGLFDRTRFLKRHKQERLVHPTSPENNPLHPLLVHASLPISLLVSIKYGEDVMKALALVKVDYSLVEVNEDTVLIEVNILYNEDKSRFIENLNSLSYHSFPTTLEEHNHVNY
jgi:hypothetical protein